MTASGPAASGSAASGPAVSGSAASGSAASGAVAAGAVVDLEVGPVAHGGHCVARLDGQVVFVRHALPGELVRARVTESGRFLRADSVEVLRASPDRVTPPCRYAGPGRCGGCDFQHATLAAQRELKAAVVREQLTRLAGLPDVPVHVEPLDGAGRPDAHGKRSDGDDGWPEGDGPPDGDDGLGWRTRMRYTAGPDGRLGLLRHRSHEVVPVDRCLIAHPDLRALPLTEEHWPAGSVVEAVRPAAGEPTVLYRESPADRRYQLVDGPGLIIERAVDREWTIQPDGFWQIHPAAAETLAAAVVEFLAPRPGDRAWDLYGGAGLFAAALAPRVGRGGRVTIVEVAAGGVGAARRCLADTPQVRVVRGDVAEALANPRWRRVDLVVADPPRTGLGARVTQRIVQRRPRAVAYVSCDPATFARDVREFAAGGYRLAGLRAFDAFPHTQHVEVVGLLSPSRP